MDVLHRLRRDLVIANRILANEGVIDAYGHVSVRHPARPDTFLLSRSRSPEFVVEEDIMEFSLEGGALGGDERHPYLERFIHGGLYEARPDIRAVIHAHPDAVLPYSITGIPLQAVVHDASDIGERVPVWEIRDKFGDETDLLVRNVEMGRDLAAAFGDTQRAVLMRGHGLAAGAPDLASVVRMAVYMVRNAHTQTIARSLGSFTPLSAGEIRARREGASFQSSAPAMWRSWEYWAERAGCADLLSV